MRNAAFAVNDFLFVQKLHLGGAKITLRHAGYNSGRLMQPQNTKRCKLCRRIDGDKEVRHVEREIGARQLRRVFPKLTVRLPPSQ